MERKIKTGSSLCLVIDPNERSRKEPYSVTGKVIEVIWYDPIQRPQQRENEVILELILHGKLCYWRGSQFLVESYLSDIRIGHFEIQECELYDANGHRLLGGLAIDCS